MSAYHEAPSSSQSLAPAESEPSAKETVSTTPQKRRSKRIKLGRLSLKPEDYQKVKNEIGRAADLVAQGIISSLEAGYIVHGLQREYAGLELSEIAEMLQQLNRPLGASRLSQLGKVARYVNRRWLVPGMMVEDYYAIVRHCDKMVKLDSPHKSSRALEGKARELVKQAINVVKKHGRRELGHRLEARRVEIEAADANRVKKYPEYRPLPNGWTRMFSLPLSQLLPCLDKYSVDLVITPVHALKPRILTKIGHVLKTSGRIDARSAPIEFDEAIKSINEQAKNVVLVLEDEAWFMIQGFEGLDDPGIEEGE